MVGGQSLTGGQEEGSAIYRGQSCMVKGSVLLGRAQCWTEA